MQIHKRGDVPLLSDGELGRKGFDINESFCILESLPGRSNASSSEGTSSAPLSQIDPPNSHDFHHVLKVTLDGLLCHPNGFTLKGEPSITLVSEGVTEGLSFRATHLMTQTEVSVSTLATLTDESS